MTDPHDKHHKHDKHHSDKHLKHTEKGNSMRPTQSSEEPFHAPAKMASTETRDLRTNTREGHQYGKSGPSMHGSTVPETRDRFGAASQMKGDTRQINKSDELTKRLGKEKRGRG